MRRLTALLCLALAACQSPSFGNPFYSGPALAEPTPFEALLTDPGVYAGQEIVLTGLLSAQDGQACLTDRGRRMAVRLTARQAALYEGVEDWPVTLRGVFAQAMCPPNRICPGLCAPHGLAAGVELYPNPAGG